jgi:hypothetical protein
MFYVDKLHGFIHANYKLISSKIMIYCKKICNINC